MMMGMSTTRLLWRSSSFSRDYATICSNQLPYTWQGVTFNAAGTQDIHLSSTVTGCDSLVHLHLTVNPTLTGDDYETICSNQLPYTWCADPSDHSL